MTIWRMRITCWIPKATDTHSEYVIFIAFPLQQWLQERVSLLRYTLHLHYININFKKGTELIFNNCPLEFQMNLSQSYGLIKPI